VTAPVNVQLATATAQAAYWQARASGLQNQLEMNGVHLAFSARENDQLRKKLYAKSEPSEPRSQGLKCQARLLTTDEVMGIEVEKAAEKAEKEEKRLKKQEKKLQDEAEHARVRDALGRNIRFKKPLKRMHRSELDDVIAVLSLPRDQKNIQECIRAIEAHVEKFPDLKVDPRFGRIFDSRFTTPPPAGFENHPPQLPKMPFRFDTPKPDFKKDEPSTGALQSANFSAMSSQLSYPPLYFNPNTTSFTFPPSAYGYPPPPFKSVPPPGS
jgi:hypothetical protein